MQDRRKVLDELERAKRRLNVGLWIGLALLVVFAIVLSVSAFILW